MDLPWAPKMQPKLIQNWLKNRTKLAPFFGVSESLLGSLLKALGASGAPFWEPWSSILGASGSPGVPWRRLGRQKSHRTDFVRKLVNLCGPQHDATNSNFLDKGVCYELNRRVGGDLRCGGRCGHYR